MDMEALVAVQPADDLLVFVGGIVVADQVDLFLLGDGLIDEAEKFQPLLMPVPLLAETKTSPLSVSRAANNVAVPLRL